MLPKGGEAIWGNLTWAPDDEPGQRMSFGAILKYAPKNATTDLHNATVSDSLQFLLQISEDWYQDQLTRNYSHGVALTRTEIERNEKMPSKWVNPLESRLPLAPNLKIYCFYGEFPPPPPLPSLAEDSCTGVGKPTERR